MGKTGMTTWYRWWKEWSRSEETERSSIVKEVMRYHPLSKRLKKILQEKRQIVFFYLDVVRFAEIEQKFGERTAGDLLALVENGARKVSHDLLPRDRLLEVENFWGDDFLVCFQGEDEMDERDVYDLAAAFRLKLVREVNTARPKLLSAPLDLHIGYAVMKNSGESLERQLYQTVKRAVKMARKTAKGGDEMIQEFQDLLLNANFDIHYQPIIALDTGEAMGWEALTRGPRGSRFERPDTLFAFAEETGDLYRLERLCRERSIEQARTLPGGSKLFLNINPRTIDDPQFTKGETRRLLDRSGLAPSHIVFEITERHSIHDYEGFRKTLEHYRQQGYLIAVDDAGAGYSSLQSIVELCPDFIKMDMSLIRGIDNDPVKQALLEAFVNLAAKIKCKIIAEGIETQEELSMLLSLGINYGQGYLLGRPDPELTVSLPPTVAASIERRRQERVLLTHSSMLEIGSIATSTFVMPLRSTIKEVHELLENRRHISSVVIVEGRRPVGLLTRDHLYSLLGSQYGVPLYFKRTVCELMDQHPLVVEGQTRIDEVSALATGRNNYKRYDDIIVTDHGELRGIVSVQTLLDIMSKVKIEIAKYANPLTGLPGNLRIEEELRRRVRHGERFVVLYIDLDRFKQFNDKCGFEYGDQMILYLAELLSRQVSRCGTRHDFLGHIGGDDFVICTTQEVVDRLANRIVRTFERAVRRQLRQAGQAGHGCLSVSLAAIDIPAGTEMTPLEIAAQAAEMKAVAKARAGNSYVRKAAK